MKVVSKPPFPPKHPFLPSVFSCSQAGRSLQPELWYYKDARGNDEPAALPLPFTPLQ